MVLPSIRDELLEELGKLGSEDQHRVLDFARALVEAKIRGTPGRALLRFSGVLTAEDAEQISAAIEEGCEKVNLDEW